MPSVGRPVENGLSAEFVIAKPAVISSFGAEQKVAAAVVFNIHFNISIALNLGDNRCN